MKRRGRLFGSDPQQLSIDWVTAEQERSAPVPPSANAEKPPAPSENTDKSHVAKVAKTTHPLNRVVARLPVPRPLPAAVEAGHFGRDEQGNPIRPEADEVRAITESLAEQLVDLLDAMKAIKDPGPPGSMQKPFRDAIAMYAQDFGQRPAQQLEAYVRRRASRDEISHDEARQR